VSHAEINFNCEAYEFNEILRRLFCNNLGLDYLDLHFIHEHLEKYNLFTEVGKDSATVLHKLYYEYCNVGSIFHNDYLSFINLEISQLFRSNQVFQKQHKTNSFLYQKIPTFRVHLPNNVAVAQFHKDRHYNHNPWETNISLPITCCEGNNAIWIESEEDKTDYYPMEGSYGTYFVFDGANLCHGNKLNDTDSTRISIDFRILPLDKYQENEKTSVAVNTKMTIGDYWLLYDNN